MEVVRGGGLKPVWKMTYPGAFRFAVPVKLEKDSTHQFYARLKNGEFGRLNPVFKMYGEDLFEELTNLDWRNFWQGIFMEYSIVKKFVDAMDGDLKLKSEEERGACFIIEFEKNECIFGYDLRTIYIIT